ncbi:MAG: hypothetical protein EOO53_07510 [Gammaproteobacteria bacterium]|nr:MAG: hypothetical protein EOO53_07510 [Gammaproteobacteria bacterium]
MLQSRASIPLVAIAILAIAGCILYLLNVGNIFNGRFTDLSVNTATTDNDPHGSDAHYSDGQHNRDIKKPFDKINSARTANPQKTDDADVDEQSKSVPTTNDSRTDTNSAVQADAPTASGSYQRAADSVRYSHDVEIQRWWQIYSNAIPPLYSAPLQSETQENLANIAQLSAQLDQLYPDDKSAWLIRFSQVRGDFIEAAVKGEREGARALSFQYVHANVKTKIDALTWAMVANAIAENHYYLYICFDDKSMSCSESTFKVASVQAQTVIHDYGFSLKSKK